MNDSITPAKVVSAIAKASVRHASPVTVLVSRIAAITLLKTIGASHSLIKTERVTDPDIVAFIESEWDGKELFVAFNASFVMDKALPVGAWEIGGAE